MRAKALEIRDRATFIPALAIEMVPENERQWWLLRRAGYAFDVDSPRLVSLTYLNTRGQQINFDPYGWPDRARTMPVAHKFITENWDTLNDGDVVDVEFILGESKTQKLSEREDVDVWRAL